MATVYFAAQKHCKVFQSAGDCAVPVIRAVRLLPVVGVEDVVIFEIFTQTLFAPSGTASLLTLGVEFFGWDRVTAPPTGRPLADMGKSFGTPDRNELLAALGTLEIGHGVLANSAC